MVEKGRFMRRCIVLSLIGSCAILGSAGVKAESPSYYKDIAPILQKNCQDCHRPGQVAPFSLLTYDQARKRQRPRARHLREGHAAMAGFNQNWRAVHR